MDIFQKIEQALGAGERLRIHGNGFLQLDLDNKTKRLHVFDPALPCRQERPTVIHDHTQGFLSHVLFGTMINVSYRLVPGSTYRVWTGFKNGPNYQLSKSDQVTDIKEIDRLIIPTGFSYQVAPFVFHQTVTDQLTITVIEKQEQMQGVESVLCPIEYEPDNIFNRHDYPEQAAQCLIRAIRSLKSMENLLKV